MFFCFAQEIQNEFGLSTKYLAKYPHQIIFAPLVRRSEKAKYAEAISTLKRIGQNVMVSPIYLESPNSSYSNLLKPNVLLSDFKSIIKVMKMTAPDVVVCFYISHAYPLIFMKLFANFFLCVVAMGSDINCDNAFLQRIFRKLAFQKSNLIFARSWTLKDQIEKEYACNVIVNPSSTDISFFRPLYSKSELRNKWRVNSDEYVILTACRLDKRKGVDVLMKALKLAQAMSEDSFRLLIAGEGTQKEDLEDLACSLGISENVTFLGLRSKDELLELYNLSDVFVLASYSEGLPRVVIEAMACGLIPIATNVGSVGKLVKDGYNGFLVPAGDVKGLVLKIQQIQAYGKHDIKLMQERACFTIRSEFDMGKTTENMIETIDSHYCNHK